MREFSKNAKRDRKKTWKVDNYLWQVLLKSPNKLNLARLNLNNNIFLKFSRNVVKIVNIKEQDFQLIKRNQMNEQEKIKKADFLINTDKSLLETTKS